jgi:rare lipoprotein A
MPPGVTWGGEQTTTASTATSDRAVVRHRKAPTTQTVAGAEAATNNLQAEFGKQLRPGVLWEVGFASYYGPEEQGQSTASGEPFDYHQLTAAHRTLPFGTRIRVIDPVSGRSVIVRINDRGPFMPRRVLDLSAAAAKRVGVYPVGVKRVRIEIVSVPQPLLSGRYTVQAGMFHDATRVESCRLVMERALPYPAISFRSASGNWVRYAHGVSLDHVAANTVAQQLRQRDFPAYVVRLN